MTATAATATVRPLRLPAAMSTQLRSGFWRRRAVDGGGGGGGGGGDGERLFLVFRGTASHADVVRDLVATSIEQPADACAALRFHGGFYSGVAGRAAEATQLRAHLRARLDGSHSHLYVMGHSLGGSLALTLPCVMPPLLPPTHRGRVTVVAVGSPPVIYCGPTRAAAAGGASATPRARATW